MSQINTDPKFEKEVDQLIFSGIAAFERAEKLLLERYAVAESQKDQATLEYMLQLLVFLYTMRKDLRSAKETYLRWESISDDPSFAKAEYAFFLFSGSREYGLATEKVIEVEELVNGAKSVSPAQLRSLFRSLHVKGRALLKLKRTKEVESTLRRVNEEIETHPEADYAYELDLIEECLDEGVALAECATYLQRAKWSESVAEDFVVRQRRCLERLSARRGDM